MVVLYGTFELFSIPYGFVDMETSNTRLFH